MQNDELIKSTQSRRPVFVSVRPFSLCANSHTALLTIFYQCTALHPPFLVVPLNISPHVFPRQFFKLERFAFVRLPWSSGVFPARSANHESRPSSVAACRAPAQSADFGEATTGLWSESRVLLTSQGACARAAFRVIVTRRRHTENVLSRINGEFDRYGGHVVL